MHKLNYYDGRLGEFLGGEGGGGTGTRTYNKGGGGGGRGSDENTMAGEAMLVLLDITMAVPYPATTVAALVRVRKSQQVGG